MPRRWRKEIAEAIPYFQPLARGDLGPFGIFLGKGKGAEGAGQQKAAMAKKMSG